MSEPVIHPDVALSLIRGLSGAPGYPFHSEGEARAAAVLRECCLSVEHARRVVEEFEADFPELEQIRSVAFRLREKFEPKKPEAERPPTRDEAWHAVKDKLMVPEISGQRWEVSLQIQCIRISMGMCGTLYDEEEMKEWERDFPEAVEALRAGREPNYRLVEKKLAKQIPGFGTVAKSVRMPTDSRMRHRDMVKTD